MIERENVGNFIVEPTSIYAQFILQRRRFENILEYFDIQWISLCAKIGYVMAAMRGTESKK